MIHDDTAARLNELVRQFHDTYGLGQVYFTRRFGKRRHFLAGFGEPAFEKAGRLSLSENVELHWHGVLTETQQLEVAETARPIAQTIEKETAE